MPRFVPPPRDEFAGFNPKLHWHIAWTIDSTPIEHVTASGNTVANRVGVTVLVSHLLDDEPETAIAIRPCEQDCPES